MFALLASSGNIVSRASLRIGRRLDPEELREMIGAYHSVMPRNIQIADGFSAKSGTDPKSPPPGIRGHEMAARKRGRCRRRKGTA